MRRIVVFTLASSLVSGCSLKHSEMKSLAHEGRCEEAADAMTQANSRESVNQSAWQAGGTIASYTATLLGYSTDAVVVIAGGVVIAVTICSPALALDAATAGRSQLTGKCVGGVGKEILKPRVGKNTYEGTEDWRKKDLSAVSANLRAIAACYEKRNQGDDLQKSLKQLSTIKDNPDFWQSISKKERTAVEAQHLRLSEKMGLRSDEVKAAEESVAEDILPATAWLDPVTGFAWRICGKNLTADRADRTCSRCGYNAMELPGYIDISNAYTNGISPGQKTHSFSSHIKDRKVWVRPPQSSTASTGIWFDMKTGRSLQADDASSVGHVICVDKHGK